MATISWSPGRIWVRIMLMVPLWRPQSVAEEDLEMTCRFARKQLDYSISLNGSWRGRTPSQPIQHRAQQPIFFFNPFSFYIPFFSEKAPLSYTFYWKKAPLSYTFLRGLINKLLKQKVVLLIFFHGARNKLKQEKMAS